MRSSSGWSGSARRTGQGWKSKVPRFAAQTSTACSVGQNDSAVRPLGNVTVAVSAYGGAPLGMRLT